MKRTSQSSDSLESPRQFTKAHEAKNCYSVSYINGIQCLSSKHNDIYPVEVSCFVSNIGFVKITKD